jgi:plastocyanin
MKMADHTIHIEVDPNGHITYRPAVLRAKPGDTVSWHSDDGQFALSFHERSPLGSTYIEGQSKTPTARQAITPQAMGEFHYSVALRTDRDGRIWMNSGCPEIFV